MFLKDSFYKKGSNEFLNIRKNQMTYFSLFHTSPILKRPHGKLLTRFLQDSTFVHALVTFCHTLSILLCILRMMVKNDILINPVLIKVFKL